MSEFKGSDLLMKCLAELGVKHIFGMGGHGNLAICDGLYKARILTASRGSSFTMNLSVLRRQADILRPPAGPAYCW